MFSEGGNNYIVHVLYSSYYYLILSFISFIHSSDLDGITCSRFKITVCTCTLQLSGCMCMRHRVCYVMTM